MTPTAVCCAARPILPEAYHASRRRPNRPKTSECSAFSLLCLSKCIPRCSPRTVYRRPVTSASTELAWPRRTLASDGGCKASPKPHHQRSRASGKAASRRSARMAQPEQREVAGPSSDILASPMVLKNCGQPGIASTTTWSMHGRSLGVDLSETFPADAELIADLGERWSSPNRKRAQEFPLSILE